MKLVFSFASITGFLLYGGSNISFGDAEEFYQRFDYALRSVNPNPDRLEELATMLAMNGLSDREIEEHLQYRIHLGVEPESEWADFLGALRAVWFLNFFGDENSIELVDALSQDDRMVISETAWMTRLGVRGENASDFVRRVVIEDDGLRGPEGNMKRLLFYQHLGRLGRWAKDGRIERRGDFPDQVRSVLHELLEVEESPEQIAVLDQALQRLNMPRATVVKIDRDIFEERLDWSLRLLHPYEHSYARTLIDADIYGIDRETIEDMLKDRVQSGFGEDQEHHRSARHIAFNASASLMMFGSADSIALVDQIIEWGDRTFLPSAVHVRLAVEGDDAPSFAREWIEGDDEMDSLTRFYIYRRLEILAQYAQRGMIERSEDFSSRVVSTLLSFLDVERDPGRIRTIDTAVQRLDPHYRTSDQRRRVLESMRGKAIPSNVEEYIETELQEFRERDHNDS